MKHQPEAANPSKTANSDLIVTWLVEWENLGQIDVRYEQLTPTSDRHHVDTPQRANSSANA